MPIPRDVRATQRMLISTASYPTRPYDAAHERGDAERDWDGHLAAGRIGSVIPISPEQLANLEATERAFGIPPAPRRATW